jgi:malate dehydrogenase (oxaloacetate-decarboxylating)(NADP+)
MRKTISPSALEPFLDHLCDDVELEQNREIAHMTSWLANKSMTATAPCSGNDPLSHMGMVMGCGDGNCQSTQLFMHENMQMHAGMAIDFTGDPGIDFVRGMIPHHIGALRMCGVMRNTTSPSTLEPFLDHLCDDVEREQNREIAHMTSWLANKSMTATAPCPVDVQTAPTATATGSCGRGHTMGMDGKCHWTWCWLDDRPTAWAVRWDNIPLGLFWIGLFVGGPLMQFGGVFGPQSFLHRRPMKAVRSDAAKLFYIEWLTELTFKELALVILFAISVITKFVFHYRYVFLPGRPCAGGFERGCLCCRSWFLYMGLTQPAARGLSHTLGVMMGITFILPHRSAFLLWVTGTPKERAIGFHTCVAQAFYFACCLKLTFMLIGYVGTDLGVSHLFSVDMDPRTRLHPGPLVGLSPIVPLYGVLMWVTFTLAFVSAMNSVRRKLYDLFLAVHLPLVLGTLLFAFLHSPGAAITWILPPLLFLAADKVLVVRDKFFKQSSVLALESLADDACRVTLSRSDSFKYTAGQYVYVGFDSIKAVGGIPTLSEVKAHPYSIVSAPGDGSQFEIVIKGMGDGTWSQSLCDVAASAPSELDLKVRISGPLGKLQIQLPLFKHAVLFAGGIGVTPLLSIFLDLLSRHADTPMKKVTLVWVVRDAADAAWFDKAWNILADCNALDVFSVQQYVTNSKSKSTEIQNPLDEPETKTAPATQRLLSLPKSVVAFGGLELWNQQESLAELDRHLFLTCAATSVAEAVAQLSEIIEAGDDVQAYLYMRKLIDRDVDIGYATVLVDPEKLLPIVYTPTVGRVCQTFGTLPLSRRGLYLSALEDRGRFAEALSEYAAAEGLELDPKSGKPICECIVFTDGGRILGLGDLGAWGMGIPVGKLDLYTVFGGFNPARTIPVLIDAGCAGPEKNTARLTIREHKLYTGSKTNREMTQSAQGTEVNACYYGDDNVIDEFMSAATEVFGESCLLQFEDFGSNDAFPLLADYRDKYLCYNDDIQGTAAVVVAGLLGGIKLRQPQCADLLGELKKQTILFHGAGTANLGTIDLLAKEGGVNRDQLFITNSRGLIWVGGDTSAKDGNFKNPQQAEYGYTGKPAFPHGGDNLAEIIAELKPSCLVGAVGVAAGCFTKPVVESLVSADDRPIVFALSNPTSQAEITAEDCYTWSQGKAIYGSGSSFGRVEVNGELYHPAQVNNAYIFPGLSLGVVQCSARTIPNRLFMVAAEAVAASLTEEDIKCARVLPSSDRLREVSLNVAIAVVMEAQQLKIAQKILGQSRQQVQAALSAAMWTPSLRNQVLDVREGRPSAPQILEEMKSSFIEDSDADDPGVAVLSCGPIRMQEDVHDAVQAAQSDECRFSLHRETFIL